MSFNLGDKVITSDGLEGFVLEVGSGTSLVSNGRYKPLWYNNDNLSMNSPRERAKGYYCTDEEMLPKYINQHLTTYPSSTVKSITYLGDDRVVVIYSL